jgi:hypothetical protein
VKKSASLAAAVAVCLAASPSSSAPPDEPALPRAHGVRALDLSIKRTQARLATLVGLASQSPEAILVRTYRNYPEEALKDTRKREVRAENLVKNVIANDKVPEEVRGEAAKALAAEPAVAADPDLALDGRGRSRPRARLSLLLTPLLERRDDKVGRVIAKDLLMALWPQHADPDIARYDPDVRATWSEARRRWERFLK